MINIYKKNREIINYLIVGVLTTLISIGVYYILTVTILDPNKEFELQLANVISWVIAVLFAYITNRRYVFVSKNKNILSELIKFSSSRVTTLLIEMIFMFITVSVIHLNDKIMKIAAQVIVIILNYVFSKIFVFKKEKK